MCRQNHVHMEREKSIDNREYNQLESLTSSSNTEISRLSLIVKNLKERLESLERNQTDLMSKLNDLQKEMDAEDDGDNTD
jgi:predicted transcriptional regulator